MLSRKNQEKYVTDKGDEEDISKDEKGEVSILQADNPYEAEKIMDECKSSIQASMRNSVCIGASGVKPNFTV